MNLRRHKRAGLQGLHWILLGWMGITAFFALQREIDLLWGVVMLLAFGALAGTVLPMLQVLGVRVRRLHFPATAIAGEPQRVGYQIEAAWYQ